ncbi:protocadherin gamma-A6-like [Trichomycterus rosablanca]|uniref:protocadherin gamma-A6-like n=1 Tax=Trichomycterus rosablanca TaxID=2290929 RepID=UPI002F34FD54
MYRFEVNIQDINDNTPTFSVTKTELNISELAISGERFHLPSAFDADVGINSVKSYRLTQNEYFSLDVQSSGERSVSAELVLQKAIDREKEPVIQLVLTAVDGGKPPRSGTLQIMIKVEDVNDNVPVCDKSLYKARVIENSPPGTPVIKVHATDLDEGQNSEIMYSFINQNDNTPIQAFSIDPETGLITVHGVVDFETQNAVEIRVQAKDKGQKPRAGLCKVLVEIVDVNDNVPVISVNSLVDMVKEDASVGTMNDNRPGILAPYSDHGSVHTENVPYSAEAGYLVAKIRAVDADSGYNALLSYHISEPKGNNLFRIGTSSGEIRTTRRMSDNDRKIHPLVILISDNGEPSLSTTVSIDIVVHESKSDIQTPFKNLLSTEERFSDLNLYLLIAIVSVSVMFLFCLISLIAVKCFRLDGNLSRRSAPVISTHPEGSWSYSKSAQQYDVCFSSDTLKSDMVVFPAPFSSVDAELISINGEDRTQTLLNNEKGSQALFGTRHCANIPSVVLLDSLQLQEWICTVFIFVLLCLCKMATSVVAYSIFEEAPPGSPVGNLAKELNLNVQDLESRELQIATGAYSRYFDINLKTGVLNVKERLNREDVCAYSLQCSMALEAVVKSPLNIYRFEVNVLDINDNSPVFRQTEWVLNISESAFPGERFTLPTAYDADVGSNSVKNYKLSPNEHFSLDVHSGERSVSAELALQKALDREKQPAIELVLTAIDGGNPPRSGTIPIVINVLDVNDNIPIFSKSLYKVRVAEHTPYGTHLTTVFASDSDEGPNREIVYALINLENDKTTSLFSINPKTGEITVNGDIDYERENAIELRVQAKDKGHNPRAALCKVLVEIVDINDNMPEISLTSFVDTVKEDSPTDTMVGMITVIDKDAGKNGQVTLKIGVAVPFKIKKLYNNYYTLAVNEPLDRENVFQYKITITATDEGAPPLSSTAVITVHISDVNDNAPRFPEPSINVYVNENSQIGTLIYTVTAVDPDVGDNARISYSLLESSNIFSASSLINLHSDRGDIYTLQSFDYEQLKTFHFKVQATDFGIPPMTSNVTVNVFILDENDNSPGILAPYSEHSSVHTETIPYSSEAGYFVSKIRAVDADSGYNALLSYHISEPKGNNLFRIGTSSGEIRTKRRMSDNDLKTHPLVILVSDNGEPPLSATVSIDVVVVESTDDIKTQFNHMPKKEERFSDLNLYLLIAIVLVSVIFLLSFISLVAVKCYRTDEHFSRYSAPVITTHPDGSWSYSKSTQQYDVCFSSDTLKSDVTVFPAPFSSTDAELISINGGDTFNQIQTLPSKEEVRLYIFRFLECIFFGNCLVYAGMYAREWLKSCNGLVLSPEY